ncbi:MAG TPA: PLP-dependent aminotransferase family protein [Rhizomicrobium sp.]
MSAKPRKRSPGVTSLLHLKIDATSDLGLQNQIRQKLIDAILSGAFPAERRLPSSRALAGHFGVARNTVVLAYQLLAAEGYLIARERSGLYVNEDVVKGRARFARVGGSAQSVAGIEWKGRLRAPVVEADAYRHPPDWQKYPHPFIEGRFDRSLFPVSEWREATRMALGVREINQWSTDAADTDDPMLVEEILKKILPRRGIEARPDEVLLTAGSQQALYILVELLTDRTTRVALEEPGDVSVRQMLQRRGIRAVHQPVDEAGLVVNEALDGCGLVYVTPSHQRPTAATLSMERRQQLLAKAAAKDFVVIEDDFECETNYLDDAYPAMRGLEGGDRVIYVADLSRVLSPGIGLGFIVASPEVIAQARRLRALVSRHPPLNNQRTAALFLSLGHYDSTMLRLGRVFRDRLLALRDALNHYLPQSIAIAPVRGGTTYWVRGPAGLSVHDLAREAQARGVLIEPIDRYYAAGVPPEPAFRLGVTGIPAARIRDGIAILAEVIRELSAGNLPRVDLKAPGWLTPAELRRQMPGATLLCKSVFGEPCTIELSADGRLVGRAGYANEDRDEGRWWIEEDFWCRQWNAWSYGEVARFRTRIEGVGIQWFNDAGRLVDSAVFVPRRAHAA